jgi:hypothetical protein
VWAGLGQSPALVLRPDRGLADLYADLMEAQDALERAG